MNATRTFLEAIVTAGRYGLQLSKYDEADTIKRDAFEAGLIKLSHTKRATLTTSGLEYLSEIESKPKKSSRGGKAPAPRHTAHTDCDHDTTKAARAKCRRDRAKLAE